MTVSSIDELNLIKQMLLYSQSWSVHITDLLPNILLSLCNQLFDIVDVRSQEPASLLLAEPGGKDAGVDAFIERINQHLT